MHTSISQSLLRIQILTQQRQIPSPLGHVGSEKILDVSIVIYAQKFRNIHRAVNVIRIIGSTDQLSICPMSKSFHSAPEICIGHVLDVLVAVTVFSKFRVLQFVGIDDSVVYIFLRGSGLFWEVHNFVVGIVELVPPLFAKEGG